MPQLNDLENRSRRNNLIFKGLKQEGNDNAVGLVKDFCVNVLGARNELCVTQAYPLGRKQVNGPITAHIPNDHNIKFIGYKK